MDTPLQRLRRSASHQPWFSWLLALLLLSAPLARALPLHAVVVPYCSSALDHSHAPAAPQHTVLRFGVDAAALDHSPPGLPPPALMAAVPLPDRLLATPHPAQPSARLSRHARPPAQAPPISLA